MDTFLEILRRLHEAHIEPTDARIYTTPMGPLERRMEITFDVVDVEHADWAFDHLASTGAIPERSDTRLTIAANVDH